MSYTSPYPGPRARFPGQIAIPLRTRTLPYLTHLAATYGDIVSFRIGRRAFFLFSHPDAIRDVLVTRADAFVKGPALQRARPALGDGLLTSEGDLHRRQRRLSQPALHPQRVATYAGVMFRYAREAIDRWQDGQEMDLHREMMRLTLRIVAKTLFDAEVEREVDELGRAMDVMVNMFTRALAPWGLLLNALPLPSNFRFKRSHRRLLATIDRMIAERRAEGPGRNDLLSILLRARDEESNGVAMDDRQLRDESLTLFTAGHETTANALTFSLYLLAENSDVQRRLHEELSALSEGEIGAVAAVDSLVYTRAVLAESMRLYPPAWALGRQATRDVEAGGARVPKNSVLLMSQWVVHRDARWWPDPERFDPSRWLDPARMAAMPRWAYFPFGGGPRQCIGESFAWMEATLLLATICRRWRIERIAESGPLPLRPVITLRPRNGFVARVRSWA